MGKGGARHKDLVRPGGRPGTPRPCDGVHRPSTKPLLFPKEEGGLDLLNKNTDGQVGRKKDGGFRQKNSDSFHHTKNLSDWGKGTSNAPKARGTALLPGGRNEARFCIREGRRLNEPSNNAEGDPTRN